MTEQSWPFPKLAPLQKEALTYDTLGRVATRMVNDVLVTEYRYTDPANGTHTVREYRYADTQPAPAAPAQPFSETFTSADGRIVTRTGTGVVAETRTLTALGAGRTRETVARGGVESVRDLDGVGRTVGELISVPDGAWRSWTYDVLGRREGEWLSGTPVRSWSYAACAVTETATPGGAEPPRVVVHSGGYVADPSMVWEERRDSVPQGAGSVVVSETRVKVAGFAADELSVRKFKGADGNWTTTTATLNSATQTVTESTVRPGASEPQVRQTQAGLLVSEKTPGAAPTTYTYDALGRVQTVKQNVVNGVPVRTTTIGYDPIYGQPASVATANTLDANTTGKTQEYYAPIHESAGRLKSSTVDTLTTYSAWTPRGELRAQWGATYPVKYEYDDAGRLHKMWTYRTDPTGATPAASNPEAWPAGDETEWVYYDGTMALQQKKKERGRC